MEGTNNNHRYSFFVTSYSDYVPPANSADDGFILEFIMGNRYENFYFHRDNNARVVYNITDDLNPKKSTFLMRRETLTSGSLEDPTLTIVMDALEIPKVEHEKILSQIKECAIDLAFHKDPPVLLPITIEISKWSAVDITDHILVGEQTRVHFVEEDLDLLLDQISDLSMESQGRIPRPAARRAVDHLVRIGSIVVRENKGEKCVICQETLLAGDHALQMNCGHTFHSDCILQWLAIQNDCPICRYLMPTEDDYFPNY